MKKQTLTDGEQKVLAALRKNSIDCSGGDFAIAEEVDYRTLGMNGQQFGAFLTTLTTKKLIDVDVTYVNGSERVTQVSFRESI